MYFLDFDHIWVIFKLLISSLGKDSAFVHYDYFVSEVDEIDSMGYQYPCLIFENALKDIFKDLLSRVAVKC